MKSQSDTSNRKIRRMRRILAIDPISRGFGYAILEGSDRLIDWGVVEVRPWTLNGCLRRVAELIQDFRPMVIVTEDVRVREHRRGQRAREVIASIQAKARQSGISYRAIPRSRVRQVLWAVGAPNMHQIARAIARRFPELLPILPRKRKCYSSEDERMRVFGSIAYAIMSREAPRGREPATSVASERREQAVGTTPELP